MNKRIILVGKGASGKDFFKDFLKSRGFQTDVSYTTRPKRQGEIEGVTYHYISEEEFSKLKQNGKFYEDVEFNGWRYATTVEEWNKKKMCIKTPSGIKQLKVQDIDESIIVYFDIDRNIRAERLAKRKDADDVGRRLAADTIDFKGFETFHIRVTDERFNPERLLKVIQEYDKI